MINEILCLGIVSYAIYSYLTQTQKIRMSKIRIPNDISVHSVIARYNENIEWTCYLPNLFLYSKGDAIQDSIPLSNVGREGHTFYHHIVTHYHKLPDYLICIQGNPFDHSPDLFASLQHYFNYPKGAYVPLSKKIVEEDMNDGSTWHWNLHSWYYGLPSIPKDLPKQIYTQLFGKKKMPKRVSYGAGAQFIVSKTSILKHPIEFYQSIVDLLSKSSNPVEGFVIERFHGLIFK